MIRTHRPNISTIQRITDCAAQISESSNFLIDLCISIDVTNCKSNPKNYSVIPNYFPNKIKCTYGTSAYSDSCCSQSQYNICTALSNAAICHERIQFHEYCQQDMEDQYPVLGEEICSHPRMTSTKVLRTGQHSLAWGFHIEAVNLWYQSLPKDHQYEYVWILEDDVGFSSNWINLFQCFTECKADLLGDENFPVSSNWWWQDMVRVFILLYSLSAT